MAKGDSKIGSKSINKPNEATEHYVSGEGMWINGYLRGSGNFGSLTENEKEYLKDLDTATNGIIKNKNLYRSVDASAIFGDISYTEYENLISVLEHKGQSLGKGAYAENIRKSANNLINRTTGKVIHEKGFMSTSKDIKVAENWGGFSGSSKPVVIKIKTNNKTKGVDVSIYDKNVSKSEAQKEVLLGRNQSYKINNITAKNGNLYLDVAMINKNKS